MSNVLSFSKKKHESIEDKRRSFERLVFKNFMGAYSVVHDDGTCYPITMVDLSYDGCRFQVPFSETVFKHFAVESEVKFRMYFTDSSYIPVVAIIKNISEHIDSSGKHIRFGCQFDKSTTAFEAFNTFIQFIYQFAEHSVLDKGESKIHFL